MSAKRDRKTTTGDDDVCVVCFKDITIRCIMDCEHTICFECSTRLRVLCEKLECPICRQETTIAVFTRERGTFRSMYMRALYNEDKYKLALEDEGVRRAFSLLLAHGCPRCEPRKTFPTFKQLSDHTLRQHQLQYCELCVKHLKIFTGERKVYTREKLALHKRKGDPDDSSHRGHPLCEYCQQRYNDKDELFLHLRRDHFHCHLCEADGRHIFYDDYAHLADHFREDHFLCEQAQCKDEKFVVFRTNIDLQAHRATAHSDNKSRGQQRQDRTLTLEFSTEQPGRRRRPDRHADQRNDRREASDPVEPPPPPPPQQPVNTSSQQEFPTLAGGATGGPDVPDSRGSLAQRVAGAAGMTVRAAPHRGRGRPWDNRAVKVSEDEFPSLAGGRAAPPPPPPAATAPSFSVNVQRRAPRNARSAAARSTAAEDFPSLGPSRAAARKPASAPAPARTPVPARTPASAARPAAAPAPSATTTPSFSVNVQRRAAKSANPSAPRTTNVTIDFKRRPASAEASASMAAAAAAEYDYEEVDEDVPRIAQVSNTSNITIQRQPAEPAAARSAGQGSRPPPVNKESFPSLGKPSTARPASASASWVPKKAEPAPKPVPKPTVTQPTADDFPSLGPVGAHGNFGSFAGPRAGAGQAAGASWGAAGGEDRSAGAGAKNKKKKNKKAAASENGADSVSSRQNGVTDDGTVTEAATAVNGLSLSARGPPPGLSRPPPGLPAPAPAAARSADGSFRYQEPENFTARNGRLVHQARELFQSETDFSAFKTISKTFREDGLSAEDYYAGCMALLGNDKFGKMFPELLVLLPNITKQQELLAAHEKLNKNGFQRNKFPSCPTCGQVLVFDDFAQHTSQHFEDGDFPSLG